MEESEAALIHAASIEEEEKGTIIVGGENVGSSRPESRELGGESID